MNVLRVYLGTDKYIPLSPTRFFQVEGKNILFKVSGVAKSNKNLHQEK